jgi:hypothetical protein
VTINRQIVRNADEEEFWDLTKDPVEEEVVDADAALDKDGDELQDLTMDPDEDVHRTRA